MFISTPIWRGLYHFAFLGCGNPKIWRWYNVHAYFLQELFINLKLPQIMKKHYRRFCSRGVCLILTTALMLISMKSIAQQSNSITISEEMYKYLMTKYVSFDIVVMDKIVETQRPFMVLSQETTDMNDFLGTFSKEPSQYNLARSDDYNGKFIKGELVDTSKKYDPFHLSETVYYIFKKDSTGTLYAIRDSYFKYINDYTQTEGILDIIHKLGYKEYKSNDPYGEDKNLYIKTKTCEIRLDNQIFLKLKENPNYITQLDNDQLKLSSLVKQSVTHSKTLDRYLSIYNIKRNKMSSTDLTAWRNATKQALIFGKQIDKISEKYDDVYSIMPLNKSYYNTLSSFNENVLASKGVLGM